MVDRSAYVGLAIKVVSHIPRDLLHSFPLPINCYHNGIGGITWIEEKNGNIAAGIHFVGGDILRSKYCCK
ncbi:MAG: hypothetical protein KAV87_02905 [Desulfobacteraceae bacterium]|nr:hypothetical protein [Desulfobacteraceae bacterium]